MFRQTNYDGLVWETGILDISSDTIRCDKMAPSSHSRDSVVSFCGFFSGTTILGTIVDIPGISVSGHQTGNHWFVHTESQSNIIHNVPDWTMPKALALSRLVNRTISWLNTWPIDHGPDRISILKLSRSHFCEHTPPLDLVLNLLPIWCNIHSLYHTDTQMVDLHNGIWHAQINSRTLKIYTKTLDGAEHILSSLYRIWLNNIK